MNSWHLFVTRRQAAQMQQLVLTASLPEEVRETVIERVDWREWLFHGREPMGYRMPSVEIRELIRRLDDDGNGYLTTASVAEEAPDPYSEEKAAKRHALAG